MKANRGSQPESRTSEQRRRHSEGSQSYYMRKKREMDGQPDEGPPIMIVKPLAPGAVNLMWQTTKSVEKLSKELGKKPFLFKKVRQTKKVATSSMMGGFGIKEVEIPEEDDEVVEEKKK